MQQIPPCRMNECQVKVPVLPKPVQTSPLISPPRRRIQVSDLNPHLMCVLCGGYYVDATTIIECLHSFCKSCLVKHLESSKYCPICEVQVHKNRPLQNIRSDHTLQDMVYKLVPGLFQREMKTRQEFYESHPEAPESPASDRGIIDPIECQFYSPDELVCLALELQYPQTTAISNGLGKRYLRCPAAVTVAHLQKLVRNKFDLANDYRVDLMFLDKPLTPDLSIMDVAYVFGRKRKGQFHFTYRIWDPQCKRMKFEEPVKEEVIVEDKPQPMEVDKSSPVVETKNAIPAENKSRLDSIISRLGSVKQENAVKKDKSNEKWKEVQLKISENGVMSVTNISNIDKVLSPESKEDPKAKESKNKQETKEQSVNVKTEKDKGGLPNNKETVQKGNEKVKLESKQNVKKVEAVAEETKKVVEKPSQDIVKKEKSADLPSQKPSIALGSSSTSKNSAPKSLSIEAVPSTQKTSSSAPLPKPANSPTKIIPASKSNSTHSPSTKKPPSHTPIGYKTLKSGPKNWNPSISRNSILSSKMDKQTPGMEVVSTSPSRFFKMRNAPRFLGNPASGVKPMFQVPDAKPKPEPDRETSSKTPSIMKLDPRTLTPILSNSSSSKSPSNQTKTRPPFPSTTLSAPVNKHMPSSASRSVTTTTSTSTTARPTNMPDLNTQAMVNSFLSGPFGHNAMSNLLYGHGALPGLVPPPSFADMFRQSFPPGYHHNLPQSVNMLFNHHPLPPHPAPFSPPLSSPSPSSSSSSSVKNTTPAVQRIPASSQKTASSSSSGKSLSISSVDCVKLNGAMSPTHKHKPSHPLSISVSPSPTSPHRPMEFSMQSLVSPTPLKSPQPSNKTSPLLVGKPPSSPTKQLSPSSSAKPSPAATKPANSPPQIENDSKKAPLRSSSASEHPVVLLSKVENKPASETTKKDTPSNKAQLNSDNNNCVSSVPPVKKDDKLPHNISKLFPKESACTNDKISNESKSSVVQAQQS